MDANSTNQPRKRRTKTQATIITAVEIQNAVPGAVLTLGGGLTFRATGRNLSTGKTFGRWTFRYTSADADFIVSQERAGTKTRQREKGLGSFPEVSLKDARAEASRLYAQVRAGTDPIEHERREQAARLASARIVQLTFAEAVDKALDSKLDGFRNAKHRDQWRSTLQTYAIPLIGWKRVAEITVQDVLQVMMGEVKDKAGQVIGPLWTARTETASRLRGRIESVLAWATVSGHRAGDNPARWAGNLKELLPAPSKVAEEGNQPALAIADAPRWFSDLRKRDGMGARAVEFAALTAARSGEVRGATWDEIDLTTGIWTIPAQRMKAGREHRVPLTAEAITLLNALARHGDSPLVFPAVRGGQLSDMTLSATMRRMHESAVAAGGGEVAEGYLDPRNKRPAVPHGLRSTFRQWTAERGYGATLVPPSTAADPAETEADRSGRQMSIGLLNPNYATATYAQQQSATDALRGLSEHAGTPPLFPDLPDVLVPRVAPAPAQPAAHQAKYTLRTDLGIPTSLIREEMPSLYDIEGDLCPQIAKEFCRAVNLTSMLLTVNSKAELSMRDLFNASETAQRNLNVRMSAARISELAQAQLVFNDGIDPRRIREAIETELTRLCHEAGIEANIRDMRRTINLAILRFPQALKEAVRVAQSFHIRLENNEPIPLEQFGPKDAVKAVKGAYGAFIGRFNQPELAFAQMLDGDSSGRVKWWLRNPENEKWATRLILPTGRRFFPDFVVGIHGRHTPDSIALVEIKDDGDTGRLHSDSNAVKIRSPHKEYKSVFWTFREADGVFVKAIWNQTHNRIFSSGPFEISDMVLLQ